MAPEAAHTVVQAVRMGTVLVPYPQRDDRRASVGRSESADGMQEGSAGSVSPDPDARLSWPIH